MIVRNVVVDDMYDVRFIRGCVVGLMFLLEFFDWFGFEDLRFWILVVSVFDEIGEFRMYFVD